MRQRQALGEPGKPIGDQYLSEFLVDLLQVLDDARGHRDRPRGTGGNGAIRARDTTA
jgi:hypothetical protein